MMARSCITMLSTGVAGFLPRKKSSSATAGLRYHFADRASRVLDVGGQQMTATLTPVGDRSAAQKDAARLNFADASVQITHGHAP